MVSIRCKQGKYYGLRYFIFRILGRHFHILDVVSIRCKKGKFYGLRYFIFRILGRHFHILDVVSIRFKWVIGIDV